MFSMITKKNYLLIILNNPSYLELWVYSSTLKLNVNSADSDMCLYYSGVLLDYLG